jgi:hypothetical protein
MLASLTNIRSVASVKNDHAVTLQSVVMQFVWVVKIKFAKLYTDGQTVMWQLLHDRPWNVVYSKTLRQTQELILKFMIVTDVFGS